MADNTVSGAGGARSSGADNTNTNTEPAFGERTVRTEYVPPSERPLLQAKEGDSPEVKKQLAVIVDANRSGSSRLDAALELSSLEGNTNRVCEAYLSIAQNTKEKPVVLMAAVGGLEEIGGKENEILEVCLPLLKKDLKALNKFMKQAAVAAVFFALERQGGREGQGYLQIAKDSNLDTNVRMGAAERLSRMDGQADKAGEAYLSIGEDTSVDSNIRVDVVEKLSKIEGQLDRSGKILFSMANDSRIDVRARVNAANKLSKIGGQEARAAEAFASIGSLLDYESPDADFEKTRRVRFDTASVLARFIHQIGEESDLGQRIVQEMVQADDSPNSPYRLHAALLEARNKPVDWSSLLEGATLKLNPERAFSYYKIDITPEIRSVSYSDFKSLITSAEVEVASAHEDVKNRMLQMSDGRIDFEEIAESTTIRDFFNPKKLNDESVDEVVVQLRALTYMLKNLSDQPQSAEDVSTRTALTWQFLVNIQTCPGGKETGIRTAYRDFIAARNESDEVINVGPGVELRKERAKSALIHLLQGVREDVLSGRLGSFIQNASGLPSSDVIHERPHHEIYIRNLIGAETGLTSEKAKPRFDRHTAVISDVLRSMPKQDLLRAFYEDYADALRPALGKAIYQFAFGENHKKGDEITKEGFAKMNLFTEVIVEGGTPEQAQEAGLIVMEWDDDFINIKSIEITDKGVEVLLDRLGFLSKEA